MQVQAVVNELHWGKGTIVHLVQPSGGMKYFLHSVLSLLPSPWWHVEHLSENDLLKLLENRKANDAPERGVLLCNDNNEDEEGDTSTPTYFSDLIPNDLVCMIIIIMRCCVCSLRNRQSSQALYGSVLRFSIVFLFYIHANEPVVMTYLCVKR